MSAAIAGRFVARPQHCIELALVNIDKMRRAHRGQARRWLDEWEELLQGPAERILEALTSKSPRARELRQDLPFAGVLTYDERQEIVNRFKSVEHLRRGRPR